MDEHDDAAHDASQCNEVYDTAAAAMGIWAATHPSVSGAAVGAFALGTHLTGEVVCNGGFNPGPPPSYLDGKLGYDPTHDAPPEFGPGDSDVIAPYQSDGFDYSASADSGGGGFDYSGDSGGS